MLIKNQKQKSLRTLKPVLFENMSFQVKILVAQHH